MGETTSTLRTPAAEIAPSIPRTTSLWKDAWQRMRRSPEAIIGMVIIAIFIFAAIFADWIAPYSIKEIHLGLENLPPFWVQNTVVGTHGDLRFLLGTDQLGRDLLTWAIYGARTSMTLGLVSAPLIALTGMLVGLVAGYAGGRADQWIMRITDVFYAFPPLMICILVLMAMRYTPAGGWFNGLFSLFVAFLSVGWAGAARLVRGSVLSVKHLEYIEAAHCLGIPAPRLIFKHILPNCLGPLLVWVTLMIPQLILTEAILAFLQITPGQRGMSDGLFTLSWGGMILEGRSFMYLQPYKSIIPAMCVGLVSIAFTFVGDSLRDALDPTSRSAKTR